MKSPKAAFSIAVLLIIAPIPASAYNILALDMGGYWDNLGDQQIGAIPGMGTPGLPGQRYYTMVEPQDLASVNLMDFDVFLVQSAFTDDDVQQRATVALQALEGKAADIASFVHAGHGLVAWTEPLPDGSDWNWGWSPMSLTSRGVFHENAVEITDPAHPVMNNLTDALLSDWHSSWHGYFESWDPRLEEISQSGDYGAGDPRTHRALTLAGAFDPDGDGRTVFSMQDPDFHAYQGFAGAQTLIENSLDWASLSRPIPEPRAGLLLACGLGFAAVVLRRRIGGA